VVNEIEVVNNIRILKMRSKKNKIYKCQLLKIGYQRGIEINDLFNLLITYKRVTF
jgi:hypothetical protein